MLKLILTFALTIYSLSVFACWKVDGQFAADGETFKFSQRFEHDKEYSLPLGTFILNLTIKKSDNKFKTLVYTVSEKKQGRLILVSKGEEEIEEKKSNDIYAKGEPGQPNTIITLKLN